MTARIVLPIVALLVTAPPLTAQSQVPDPLTPRGVRVRTVTDTLVGSVGGIAVDRTGAIYVADFGDKVYKVRPDGRVTVFATGLYGASGNAVDSRGRLMQSNFYGNFITRIERDGTMEVVAEGLHGPVGIAIDPEDNMVVTNCVANNLERVTENGTVTIFAEGDHFRCPNGITRAPDSTHYVVNFRDSNVLAISPEGVVRVLATLPGGGNGHIAIARGALYVTNFQGHRIYKVTLDGEVSLIAGVGRPGEQDGPGAQASFSWPNGIAVSPTGDRLYVNDFLNRFPPTIEVPPVPKTLVRQITLESFSDVLLTGLAGGGIDSLESAYRAWKANPGTGAQFSEVEVNILGYRLMGAGQLSAATKVFELNAESYPNSFNVYDSLAEAYMNGGERDKAIEYYRKSLEINPANTNATDMLQKLGAE